MIWYYIGIIVIIWCSVGFLIGLKRITIDDQEERKRENIEILQEHGYDKFIDHEIYNRKIFELIRCIIGGLYFAYHDIKEIIYNIFDMIKKKK